jgi:hypothetical protein
MVSVQLDLCLVFETICFIKKSLAKANLSLSSISMPLRAWQLILP